MNRFSPDGKALLVASLINRKALMDSLGMCEVMGLSSHYAGLLEAATGWKVEMKINEKLPGTFIEDFLIEGDAGGIGKRISNLTRAFNVREGFDKKDDRLPDRYHEETVTEGPVKGHFVSRDDFLKMRSEFYSLCGWDENGKPTLQTLSELELAKAAEDLWPSD
jgi:aldehyde:ferredoxin oxidoreductase